MKHKYGKFLKTLWAVVLVLALILGNLTSVITVHASANSPILGEIRLFPYGTAPEGWLYCAGEEMMISQNTALFSLLGTTYGGDGRTTYALPDLRASEPLDGVGYYIATAGEFPSPESTSAYMTIGELRLFPFRVLPAGWSSTEGQLLSISGNEVLFNLIGTTFGGDGQSTFKLPDIEPVIDDTLEYYIATTGVHPSTRTGQEYFGEIELLNYGVDSDSNRRVADGDLLSINGQQAFFSLLGNQFGGDGMVNFALPDLSNSITSSENGFPAYFITTIGIFPSLQTQSLSAAGDSYTAYPGSTLTADVLSNDSNALRAMLIDEPTHGTVTLNADGSFAYTPDDNYLGEDSFTYKASNNLGSKGETTVTIMVEESELVITGITDDEFYNENKMITFTDGTAKLDGSPFASGETVSTEGEHALVITTSSGMITTTVKFTIDKTKPSAPTVQFTSPAGFVSGGVTNQNVTFTINNGTDASSGVAKSQYRTMSDGDSAWGEWTDYSAPVAVSASGTTDIEAKTIDNVGNESTAATAQVNIDMTAPTLTLTTTAGSATNAPYTVTATFSEDVTGFAVDDVTVTNGTAGSFTGSGAEYTFVVTPTADGEVDVDVSGAAAEDAAGNSNSAALQLSLIYDSSEPGTGVPAADGNTDLSDLTLSSGTLSPSFDADTISYTASVAGSVSSLTVTAAVYDADATMTASVYDSDNNLLSGYPVSLASGEASDEVPLSVGANVILLAVTAQDGTTKTYTLTVTRRASSGGGSTSDSGTSTDSGFQIIVDGKTSEQIATAAVVEEDGKSVLTITVDTAPLAAQLAEEGQSPVIVIPVATDADKVTVALSGEAVQAMENKQAVLEIQTPKGSYTLPAVEIGIDLFRELFGEQASLADIEVRVDIAASASDKVTLLKNEAAEGGFTVVVPPIDFTVTVTYNGQTVEVSRFSTYVQREIALPDGVDPDEVTTAIILNEDGTVRHVPTYVTVQDGKYYAVVSSLTNSSYAVIAGPKTFADVEGHWAEDAVNDMASRMIVNGVDDDHYNPGASVTRAEFAAMIVRALGLADNGNSNSKSFTDVLPDDWYVGAVGKAAEYGIITGYEDGTFRPAKTITREEAMVIIARAMRLAGLEADISDAEAEAALAGFADGSNIDVWAKQAVAAVVTNGLASGSDAGLLPESNITRAETAVIIQRLLEKAGLIDGTSAN